jgi:hypothetical protein
LIDRHHLSDGGVAIQFKKLLLIPPSAGLRFQIELRLALEQNLTVYQPV